MINSAGLGQKIYKHTMLRQAEQLSHPVSAKELIRALMHQISVTTRSSTKS